MDPPPKDEDSVKNNKLIFFRIDGEKLLEKYKAISTKIEYLKNIELNALSVYNDRYIKIRIRKDGDKVYTNIHGLNMEVYSIDSLLVCKKNITCKYI